MAAITFCDVVLSNVPLADGLLFHELVHVEHCQLGVARFSELYVRDSCRAAATTASRLRR